jgi:hypothetical protein
MDISKLSVVVQFDKEASPARGYCAAKNATRRTARPDPSPRKERLLGMTSKLHRYQTVLMSTFDLTIVSSYRCSKRKDKNLFEGEG